VQIVQPFLSFLRIKKDKIDNKITVCSKKNRPFFKYEFFIQIFQKKLHKNWKKLCTKLKNSGIIFVVNL